MKSRLPLFISLLMGLVAILLIFFYIQKITLPPPKTPVLAAQVDIYEGETLTEANAGIAPVPTEYLPNGYITERDAWLYIGQRVKQNLKKGKPITQSDILVEEGAAQLSEEIPPGERAITIAVDEVTGVGGLIKPMDRVDIIGTFGVGSLLGSNIPKNEEDQAAVLGWMEESQLEKTVTMTLLPNVTVLATGRSLREDELQYGMGRGEGSYGNVTILVTPDEAQYLTFCQGRGQLALALRSPADTDDIVPLEKDKITEEDILTDLYGKTMIPKRQEVRKKEIQFFGGGLPLRPGKR